MLWYKCECFVITVKVIFCNCSLPNTCSYGIVLVYIMTKVTMLRWTMVRQFTRDYSFFLTHIFLSIVLKYSSNRSKNQLA